MDNSMEFYYREELMAHSKKPHNFGAIKQATFRKKETNPLCGDEIEMFAKVKKDVVAEIRFQGAGCLISIATASLLTDAVKGKRVTAVLKMSEKDVMKLLGGVVTPARKKCALLSLWTIQNGIKEYLIVNKKTNGKK